MSIPLVVGAFIAQLCGAMKCPALFAAMLLALSAIAPAAIERDPIDLLGAAEEAIKGGDFEKATALITRALDAKGTIGPEDILRGHGHYLRGIAYLEKDKLDAALADMSRAMELMPQDDRPAFFRAGIHQQKKDYDKAIADYTKVIALKPQHEDALINRALCASWKDDYEKALADFDAVLAFNPKSVAALQRRGAVFSQKGEKDKAMADFQAAIGIDPNNPTTYLFRSQLHLYEAQPESALKDLEEVMRRAPAYVTAQNDYAWTLATNPKDAVRDGHKAVEFAKKACHADDYKKGGTVDTLAAAYAESGDWAQAVKWQEEALRLAEKDEPEDVKGMKERLELYKAKKPFRELPVRPKK